MKINELLTLYPNSNDVLKRLRHTILIGSETEISEIINKIKNYIDKESIQKTIQKKEYLSNIEDIIGYVSYSYGSNLDEIRKRIDNYIDKAFTEAKNNDKKYDQYYIDDEGYLYGINNVLESLEQFEHRKTKLQELQKDIKELQGYLDSDAFEIELKELKKKYGK